MRSPIDTHLRMEPQDLAPGLKAWRCPKSGGYWIDGDIYRTWSKRRDQAAASASGEAAPATPPAVPTTLAPDTAIALLSPRTGHLLTKLAVGTDLPFRIDYDTASGGIWLDAGEFETLQARGLAKSLHQIAAPSWQRRAEAEERSDARREQLVELFGQDSVTKAEATADWLRASDHQHALLAYLIECTER